MSSDSASPRPMKLSVVTEPVPSPSALRRALARARDGKALDQAEAAILLHARGDQLAELLGYAARTRDAGLAAAGRPGVGHQPEGDHMAAGRCRDVEKRRSCGVTASRLPLDTAAATAHGDTAAIRVPSSRRTAAAASP